MSTVGSSYNFFGQGYGYAYHSSVVIQGVGYIPRLAVVFELGCGLKRPAFPSPSEPLHKTPHGKQLRAPPARRVTVI